MEFKVIITGIDELTTRLGQAPEIAAPILQASINAGAAVLAQNTVVGIVPFRTGFLIQSFSAQILAFSATWFPTASYAPDVEFGTAPHTIWPVNGEALWWPGLPHPVKRVNHPGTKANDYMGRILAMSTADINSIFGHALEMIISSISEN